jgi:hypothetical protein
MISPQPEQRQCGELSSEKRNRNHDRIIYRSSDGSLLHPWRPSFEPSDLVGVGAHEVAHPVGDALRHVERRDFRNFDDDGVAAVCLGAV